MPIIEPYIPEYITVHLGPPSSYAENVTVSFPDYIKNVASSEIYPTWNENAIYANIYAQISYALNRVYTEYYRAQGYDFDITNDTGFDQKFIYGRNFFENISDIVDEIFDSYIRVTGNIEPLAAKYCNGTTVTCQGLSQWGSQRLAEEGANYLEILKYYYGENIEIVTNVPIRGFTESYPGYPISKGARGDEVKIMQTALNRISDDYPSIPKIYPVDGIFGDQTEEVVRKMQEVFDLTPDGIVGRATWYKIFYLYNALKNLSELYSDGLRFEDVSFESPDVIMLGDTGVKVRTLQYMINVISEFNNNIPSVSIDGIFGEETENAVKAFQNEYNIEPSGKVRNDTWDLMYRIVKNTYDSILFNSNGLEVRTLPYPGYILKIGSTGEDVRVLQDYINYIASADENVDPVSVTGVYGRNTRSSVLQIQEEYGIMRTGNVNEATWDAIANAFKNVTSSQLTDYTQFPGYTLNENTGGE